MHRCVETSSDVAIAVQMEDPIVFGEAGVGAEAEKACAGEGVLLVFPASGLACQRPVC